MRLIYSFLMTVSVPFLMARLWWRGRHLPDYRERWAERLGFSLPSVTPEQRVIWIHAVSVGEVVVAAKIIRRLQVDYPDRVVLVTTTTPTGSERLTQEFGNRVLHTYLPWDIPWALSRLFKRFRPEALLLVETELWPNLLRQAHLRNTPVMLVNARLSARSARRYARISKPLLPMFDALTRICAQTSADAKRFAALGFDTNKLSVTGNLKFDQSLSEQQVSQAAALREQWGAGDKPILVAASTHEGEEVLIIEAYKTLQIRHPNLTLCLAPRHPDRFDHVYGLLLKSGLKPSRRSEKQDIEPNTQVILADTMGELVTLLGASDIAIMGGSFMPVGGHNMLEVAQWSVPVVTGPHLFNFSYVSRLLLREHAMLVAQDGAELVEVIDHLLADDATRVAMGQRGASAVQKEKGALERLFKDLEFLLG